MIDLTRLNSEALGDGKIVRLSPDSLALFLDTQQWIDDHDQWTNGGVEPTTIDFDEIDALVAKGLSELMQNPLVGSIFPVILAAMPDGALECDGSTFLRVDYPDLYAVLDGIFIIDADTAVLPDLRGRTVIGTGTGAGLSSYVINDQGGEESHVLVTSELAAHSHGITDPTHAHSEGIAIPFLGGTIAGVPGYATAGVGLTGFAGTGISINSEGADAAHENRQPFVALRYAVWAR